MAGSYIIKDGAPVIGSSPATFPHPSWNFNPIFIGEEGVSYWRTGDSSGPTVAIGAAPQWAMRARFGHIDGAATEAYVWAFPNNTDLEDAEGNTKLVLKLTEAALTVSVAERTGSSGAIIGGPSPSTFSFSTPALDGGYVYLWLYFDNGNLSVRDSSGTSLLSVPWSSLVYLLAGTVSGGAAAVFIPALSSPWAVYSSGFYGMDEEAPFQRSTYDLFYNGLPTIGTSSFWTGLVGALETT